MVTSVQGATPNRQITAMDKVSQEQLYDPGLYALRELMEPPPVYRKKNGFLRFLGNLILTAAVLGAVAVGARKYVKVINDVNLTQKLGENAKTGERIKYKIAQFGEWVEKTVRKPFVTKAKDGAADGAATKSSGAETKTVEGTGTKPETPKE